MTGSSADVQGSLAVDVIVANAPDPRLRMRLVKTELQLQHHLAKTSTELDQLDLSTALRQMRDFESDVTNAVGSAVLTASDGAALNTSADAVNACIQGIAP
jgi:hypothetical protein